MRFAEYLAQSEFVEYLIEAFNAPVSTEAPIAPQIIPPKTWSAKKPQILHFWNKTKPNMPLIMTPMAEKPDGSTSSYGEDGIRITGSWQFIAATIGRLKELLYYENPNTKLRLIFKGVDNSKNARPDRQSYVFYINMQNRGKRKSTLGV